MGHIVVTILLILSALLGVIGFMGGKPYADRLRETLTDYWIAVEGLSPGKELRLLLVKLRNVLYKHRPKFVQLYIFGVILTVGITAWNIKNENIDNIVNQINQLNGSKATFGYWVAVDLSHKFARYYVVSDNSCRIDLDAQAEHWQGEMENAIWRVNSVELYLDELRSSGEFYAKLLYFTACLLTIFVIASINLVSLLISMHITLRLLSIATERLYALLAIIVIDILTAFLVPLSLMCLAHVMFGPVNIGYRGDLLSTNYPFEVNFITLSLSISALQLSNVFASSGIISILLFSGWNTEFTAWHLLGMAMTEMVRWASGIAYVVKGHIGKIAALDLHMIPFDHAIILWSLIADFILSMLYISTAIFLVLVGRNSFLRAGVSNTLQYLADHKLGPLKAAAIAVAAAAAIIRGMGLGGG
jgi:hypothetical protein